MYQFRSDKQTHTYGINKSPLFSTRGLVLETIRVWTFLYLHLPVFYLLGLAGVLGIGMELIEFQFQIQETLLTIRVKIHQPTNSSAHQQHAAQHTRAMQVVGVNFCTW